MTAGSLIPQPHGGALLPGGMIGNRGGLGKPPNEIRARMRQHLDEELIQACLDDWKAGKLNPLQVAEFFAKHALPTQSESLNADEGKQMIAATIGRLIDILRADGRYTDQELDARHTLATEGLG